MEITHDDDGHARVTPAKVEMVEEQLASMSAREASDAEIAYMWADSDDGKPTVIQAFNAVMREVTSVGKDDYNEDQGFRFRGVDAVVNAVGPACRKHGIVVVPRKVREHSVTQYTTKRGTVMTNRVVHIHYRVYGPRGDYFDGEAFGESADAGDKSMSKSQSVAERVFLLQAGLIPTGEPDPDSESHERATGGQDEGSQDPDDYRQQTRRAQPSQADQALMAEARKSMWATAKGLGWTWEKLAARFKADHDGRVSDQVDAATIDAFTMVIVKEAEAEEDKAVAAAAEVLGAKEVEPDDKFPESRGDPIL